MKETTTTHNLDCPRSRSQCRRTYISNGKVTLLFRSAAFWSRGGYLDNTCVSSGLGCKGSRILSGFGYEELARKRGDNIAWHNTLFSNAWGTLKEEKASSETSFVRDDIRGGYFGLSGECKRGQLYTHVYGEAENEAEYLEGIILEFRWSVNFDVKGESKFLQDRASWPYYPDE